MQILQGMFLEVLCGVSCPAWMWGTQPVILSLSQKNCWITPKHLSTSGVWQSLHANEPCGIIALYVAAGFLVCQSILPSKEKG